MIEFSYLIIAFISLLRQTISDYIKNKVDLRFTSFMGGCTLMLFIVLQSNIWWFFACLIVAVAMIFLLSKSLGSGDLGELTWITPGLFLAYGNFLIIIYFYVLLLIVYFFGFHLLGIGKINKAFMPYILTAYVLTVVLAAYV